MPSNQLFKSWSFVSYGTLSINNYTGATIYYSMLLVVVAIEIENKSMDRMVSYTFFMNMDEALSMRHGRDYSCGFCWTSDPEMLNVVSIQSIRYFTLSINFPCSDNIFNCSRGFRGSQEMISN